MRKSEIPILAFFIITSLLVLTRQLSVDTQLIPTIINGVTSSTSIVVAFTGALITLAFSKRSELRQHSYRVALTMNLLAIAIAMVCTAYFGLMIGQFQEALKASWVGLTISIVTFFDFLVFLISDLLAKSKPVR